MHKIWRTIDRFNCHINWRFPKPGFTLSLSVSSRFPVSVITTLLTTPKPSPNRLSKPYTLDKNSSSCFIQCLRFLTYSAHCSLGTSLTCLKFTRALWFWCWQWRSSRGLWLWEPILRVMRPWLWAGSCLEFVLRVSSQPRQRWFRRCLSGKT